MIGFKLQDTGWPKADGVFPLADVGIDVSKHTQNLY
jgi:hypothetical protein